MRTTSLGFFFVLLGAFSPAADVVLQQPKKHGGFFAFAFSPDGRVVAGGTGAVASSFRGKTTTYGGEVVLWDARTGKLLKTLGSHGETVDWVAFARDGELLFSGSQKNGLIQAWSRGAVGPAVARLEPGTPYASRVSPEVSPDGRRLAFVTEHKITMSGKPITRQTPLRVFDVERKKVLWVVEGPDVRALAMDPGGDLLAVYLKENWKADNKTRLRGRAAKQTIELRKLASGDVVRSIENAWNVHALTFLPDGKSLAAATRTQLIRWSSDSGAEQGRFSIEAQGSPTGIAFATRGDRLAVPRFMGDRIELWDLRKEKLAAVLTTSFPDTIWWPAFSSSLLRMACKKGPSPVVIDLTGLPAGS